MEKKGVWGRSLYKGRTGVVLTDGLGPYTKKKESGVKFATDGL